jgi:hypothetical protein
MLSSLVLLVILEWFLKIKLLISIMSLKRFLPVCLIVLLVFAGCKKDKDPVPNNPDTPQPTLRQASLQANITGSFTDSFTIYEGSEYPDEGITGQYSINQNDLTILAQRTSNSVLSFQFIASISSLEIGIYALIVGENESVGSYSNSGIPTGVLSLSTGGILNITTVDAVPANLAGSNARYVSGSFNFTMEDENALSSVEANGTFTDVLVLMY